MVSLDFLLPFIEKFSLLGYWVILLVAFLESIAIVGIFIPGTVLVVIAGFLATKGIFDVGDVIFFAALGAILGDVLSFYMGRRGTRFFKNDNRLLKLSYLVRGEEFLRKHGSKSVFIGRFLGPIRPVIPFVAGMFKMEQKKFYFWNILSGIGWATLYVLLGYFFGEAWQAVATWSSRVVVFIVALFVVFFAIYALKVVIARRGKRVAAFASSLIRSQFNAIITNPDVKKLVAKHPKTFSFIRQRVSVETFIGLPLTLLALIFCYVLAEFGGVVSGVLKNSQIVAMDVQVENLLYVFRDATMVRFFLWVTFLGTWQIVVAFACAFSYALWLRRRTVFVIPLWVTLAGSSLAVTLGKFLVHRVRPVGPLPVYIEPSSSFPSGHSTAAMAFYGFLIYYLWRTSHSWKRKINWTFACAMVVLSVGFSRLYLGVHYLSDVNSGLLLGLMWLIVGISITEWRLVSRVIKIGHITINKKTRIISSGIILVALIFYVIYANFYDARLRFLSEALHVQPTVLSSSSVDTIFDQNHLSKFTETLAGNPQEPLSFLVTAHSDSDLVEAFSRAGWLKADDLSVSSVYEMCRAVITNRPYRTAPMTPGFWNSQVHNFGFEKPTATNGVSQRHHARFWKTNFVTSTGAHVYVGAASYDLNIKWLITHHIRPDVDTERETLVRDLQEAGSISDFHIEPFVGPMMGKNFTGDTFFTDGKIYVIDLMAGKTVAINF